MAPLLTHRNVKAIQRNHPLEFSTLRSDLKAKADLVAALDPKTGKRLIKRPFSDEELDHFVTLRLLVLKGGIKTPRRAHWEH